jgi:hypothetical protein
MRKITTIFLLLLIIVLPLSAFDGFSDIFGFDEELESSTTTSFTQESKGIDLSGTVSFFIEGNKLGTDFQTAVQGGLTLDLAWRGSIVDAKASLELLPTIDNEMEWIDIFTQLSILTYFEGGRIEAGLLKKEWGSGDGVHVVDVLNAPDYRKGIVDDPLEMKISEPMIMSTATFKDTTLDVVYKPMLIPMVAAEKPEDYWAMPQPNPLGSFGSESLGSILPPEALPFIDNIIAIFNPESLHVKMDTPSNEELATISNSQFGARIKTIAGPADVGFIYWNGFYNTPSFELSLDVLMKDKTRHSIPMDNIETMMGTLLSLSPPILSIDPDDIEGSTINTKIKFTRAQLFGAEATVISGPFTLMLEGGFWLSEDFKGEDPTLYNNKFVYLAGLGLMIPKTSAYLNVTYHGQYILNFDKDYIFDSDTLQASISSNGKPYMNTLVAALELPLAKEKVNVRLAGTYQFETKGYAVLPSVTWNVNDDLRVKLSGRMYGALKDSSPSLFKEWKDKDTFSIGISYLF